MARRKPLKSLSTSILVVLLAGAAAESLFYSGLVVQVGPEWVKALNATKRLDAIGWKGLVATVMLALAVISAFFWGALASKRGDILKDRLFPD